MADARLQRSLQESVLALLIHNDDHGKLVARMVTAELFDGDYADIARAALRYWKKYGKAPRHHMDELLGELVSDPKNPKTKTIREVLISLLHYHAAGINHQFVIDEVQELKTDQAMRAAVTEGAKLLTSEQPDKPIKFRKMFIEIIRAKPDAQLDMGIGLEAVDQVLKYYETRQAEFTTGIYELDRRGIVPQRGIAMLILGGTGVGKTWALIHMGKRAVQDRKKVLHVTLEMPKEEVIQRYWQSLFGMQRHDVEHKVSVLEKDTFNYLKGIKFEEVQPEFLFTDPWVREELIQRIDYGGAKYQRNLRVIQFPSGRMTVEDLEATLEMLQEIDGFIPDMIILDYIRLMKIDKGREPRFAIGENLVQLRGLATTKHAALVTAQQLRREGHRNADSSLDQVAEDWSLTNTADIVLGLAATNDERRYGLAQLSVPKARGAPDHFKLLITQQYGIGAFCLDALMFKDRVYRDLAKDLDLDTSSDDEEEENAEREGHND